MRTNVYIDGFNLYYGSLKGTSYRWLDLEKFCSLILPKNKIHKIKYYSALVKPVPSDPSGPVHQQIYLRALQTIPNLSITYGHYLSHRVIMPTADSWGNNQLKFVQVVKTEEKGSDVNLATHLLHDAYQDDYDVGVIVSNDSDLLEPIKIVKKVLRKIIGIINPQRHPSSVLVQQADFVKPVRKWVLGQSQFPQILKDARGSFSKPIGW